MAARKMFSIEQVKAVVDTRTAARIDTPLGKILLDLFTAGAIMAVYEALPPAQQVRFESLPIAKVAEFALARI